MWFSQWPQLLCYQKQRANKPKVDRSKKSRKTRVEINEM